MVKKSIILLTMLSLMVFVGNVFAEGNNYDEKFTYTVSMMNIDAVEADPRFEYIKEKFNVDFEFRSVNWSNWNEKVRIWTASGDMPDIMWMDFQRSNFSEYVNWASQGAYKPLPELPDLKSKYPNLYKLRQKMKTDDYWEIDGKLYAWPVFADTVEGKNVTTFCILYRVDWAKKVGLFHEDHNYSWEEMKEMAQAFVEEDPGNNGEGKTIGFAGIGWAWPWFAGLRQTHQLNDFALKDGEYVWAPAEPEFLEGIKEIKRLYDEGILWEDQPIANNDAAKNKFIAGELGLYFDNVNVNDYYSLLLSMKAADSGFEMSDVEPMFVFSPNGNYFVEGGGDYWSATLFSPKMSDEKFARWLELSNYMASEEGYRLATIGFEGEDYVIDEEGNIEYLWEKDKDGNYIKPYDVDAIRFFELTTMHGRFTLEDPAMPEKVRNDVFKIKMRHLEEDVYIRPCPYDTMWFNGSVFTKYFGRIDDINAKISDLVVSTNSMEELEKAWKLYIKSKESIVNRMIKELNEELI